MNLLLFLVRTVAMQRPGEGEHEAMAGHDAGETLDALHGGRGGPLHQRQDDEGSGEEKAGGHG